MNSWSDTLVDFLERQTEKEDGVIQTGGRCGGAPTTTTKNTTKSTRKQTQSHNTFTRRRDSLVVVSGEPGFNHADRRQIQSAGKDLRQVALGVLSGLERPLLLRLVVPVGQLDRDGHPARATRRSSAMLVLEVTASLEPVTLVAVAVLGVPLPLPCTEVAG